MAGRKREPIATSLTWPEIFPSKHKCVFAIAKRNDLFKVNKSVYVA